MKVMFINPKLPVFMRMPSLPLGLVSIASYLKHYGHEVKIVERLVEENDIDVCINEYKPDIVGITAMSFLGSMDAMQITKNIQAANIPVVWGGQAATAMPELILKEAHPDYIILGEGEVTWLELVNTIEAGGDVSEVAGLAYSDGEKVVFTPQRPVADISLFPDIDWELIDVTKYFSSFFNCDKMLYLHASKGCPAQCTFCSNQQFHQGKNRCRDVDQIIRDIDYLYEHGTNGIYFSDELWMPNRTLRTQLCNMLIERNYDLVWGCQMRLGVLNENDVELMYKAGCRWILFGIESGNPERIKTIKKNIDLSIAKETVQWCEQKGITVQASFIIGYPDETEEEIRTTLEFGESLGASLVVINILKPLPNSELYNDIRKKGIFEFPESIEKMAYDIEQTVFDSTTVNLTKVPDLDLKVIHYFYQWKAFSGRGSVNNDSYGIVKKMARDTVDRIFKHGIRGFFYGTFVSVKQFVSVFYYSHAYKKILKKYGLK
ncbi:MAG: B12-binding domain-containing radical SAM protein [Clostridia bacterium]|nr:B12-binding domain-containing radical SAM protein [Clostridia bacterium]